MRLIDADALIEKIASINHPDMLTIGKVVGTIDTQPTAYSIDKVVKELKKEIVCIDQFGKRYCSQQNAIEIVKAGGKNG